MSDIDLNPYSGAPSPYFPDEEELIYFDVLDTLLKKLNGYCYYKEYTSLECNEPIICFKWTTKDIDKNFDIAKCRSYCHEYISSKEKKLCDWCEQYLHESLDMFNDAKTAGYEIHKLRHMNKYLEDEIGKLSQKINELEQVLITKGFIELESEPSKNNDEIVQAPLESV